MAPPSAFASPSACAQEIAPEILPEGDDPLYPALREKALRLLARREHSAWELRQKLRAKAGAPAPAADGEDDEEDESARAQRGRALLDALLAELAEIGAQSDARFTEQICRLRYRTGRGPGKLRAELRGHQIAPETIDAAMSEYTGKWRALAARVREKKFGAEAPASYAEWAKQARFLQQRGFGEEEIEPFSG